MEAFSIPVSIYMAQILHALRYCKERESQCSFIWSSLVFYIQMRH